MNCAELAEAIFNRLIANRYDMSFCIRYCKAENGFYLSTENYHNDKVVISATAMLRTGNYLDQLEYVTNILRSFKG